MKELKKILLLCLLTLTSFVNAQITVTGTVVDDTNKPIEFVNVIILSKGNSEFVTGTVTDENGKFKVESDRNKEFILRISFVGFEDLIKNVNSSIDFGNIILKSYNELNEVIITARKKLIEQKVDRLVFNVENSISASGGDVLDALKVTPRVVVQSDNISIIGKGNPAVMIDDRIINLSGEDLSDFLRTISADDIKKIEVITNPPSKYDAEGNSGLINIILKKNKKDAWNNSARIAYIQTTFPAFSFGNTFNFSQKKVSLSASFSIKKGDEAVITTSSLFYPNEKWVGKSESRNKEDFISSRLLFDYKWNDNVSLGFQYVGNFIKPDANDIDSTNVFDSNSVLESYYKSRGDNKVDNNNNALNLNFVKKLDTVGKTVSIYLDYFNYNENQNRIFTSEYFLPNNALINVISSNIISKQSISNYSVKIDFEHPTKWADFSYGGKLLFTNSNSLVDNIDLIDMNNPSQIDAFDYKENTQSLYFDLFKKLNKKWSFKTGLRVENTNSEGFSKTLNESNKRNYIKLFPTFYLLNAINDKISISLNYGRRIKRPGYWELNPFRWDINSNAYGIGNPFLQPSLSDNIEITYSYKQKLFTTPFLSITNGDFSQVPIIDNNAHEVVYQRLNYFDSYVYGFTEIFVFNKFSWLQSFYQFTLYFSDINIIRDIEITPFKGVASIISSNNSIALNREKTFKGEINASYNFAKKAFIYEFEPTFSFDLALKFSIKKNIQASINVNDIFRTSSNDVVIYSSNTKQSYNIYYDNRYFKIALKYLFGNSKMNTGKRKIGNSEEVYRTKKE